MDDDQRRPPAATFVRHRYLSYQGYAFPWYVIALWLAFLVGGVVYVIRNILG